MKIMQVAQVWSFFPKKGATALLAFLLPNVLFAQTASEITPENLSPDLQRLSGAIVFDGGTGVEAPAGSEAIGITLSGVNVENGLPQLAEQETAFVARLTRGRIPVSELFEATAEFEAAYAAQGFILARVVLPQQSLRDGGRLRVVVVNGFVERVDTSQAPDQTRDRIERITQPLVGRPSLTLPELERQLLLAGDTPGTALRSALSPGEQDGGAVITLAPEFRPVTGFVGFGNPGSEAIGTFSFNAGIEFNSPMRFGETYYLRASGSPVSFFSEDPRSRVLAAGVVFPFGFSGLSLNAEATRSDTNPKTTGNSSQSQFERLSFRLNYPFVRSRNLNLTGRVSVDLQTDQQQLTATTLRYRDETTVLRIGGNVSWIGENGAVTSGGLTFSRGLSAFGARSAAEAAATGLSLSRVGADAKFSKFSGSLSFQTAFANNLSLALDGRFQTSFGDPMLTSEQFTLVGPKELSAFDSGAIRGDSGWVVRAEVATDFKAQLSRSPFLLRPYGFVSHGSATLEQPTAVEQKVTKASSYGFGLDVFSQSDSNFRSSSVRIEIARGERNDGEPNETRFGISASFNF